MKIHLIPILLLSACATQPEKKAVSVHPPGTLVQHTGGLRTPEQIRAYRLGRYADPGDRTVMHEAHPVYRIEKSASWNLQPQGVVTATTSKASTAAERDALVAELNRQRAATKTLTEQANALIRQSYSLNTALGQTQQIADSTQTLKRDLDEIKARLNSTEAQLRTLNPNATSVEENW